MTHGNRLVLALGLGVALAWSGGAPAAAEETGAEVRLRWAFGARPSDEASTTAVRRDTELPSGARLKLMIEPLCACSVYLVYQDSSGEIHLLYPESPARFERLQTAPDRAYVPPGSQWFQLDGNTGLETFFLLASASPLEALEALLVRHATAGPEERSGLAPQVVEEIRRLHREHRKLARPVERPVIIGGQTRGVADRSDSIDEIAVEIEAESFYSKTITIDHRS